METDPQGTALPLSGLRVLEFGSLLAGPFCGQLFADFGAEVIKCELPGIGDPMREWGREKVGGASLWWPIVARGKKSVTVNLRTDEGQDLVRRMVKDADVLVENFRPGTMERWNLGYEELSAINPRLVMVRVSGYGQYGPYSDRAGFGAIGEAMGGLRYVVGDPRTPPSRVGVSIGDSLAALFATIGALVALRARDVTGRGQVVDSAIYESVLGLMESLIPEYVFTGYIRERTGSILPNVAPSNIFSTSDGKMVLVAANQDSVFGRLCAAMNALELADDDRFRTHSARGANQAELDELIGRWTSQLEAESLLKLLHDHGVPAGEIYRAPEMLNDEHFAAREAITNVPHPELGDFPMQNVVPKLSETPGHIRWPGPRLGEHTDEVLRELLQLADDELAALRSSGIV
jgi:crotonobetainyl-CoA:carnitine CoA-transferase CaiB-like acyl-CoA transferase